jgi:hypothetical protein
MLSIITAPTALEFQFSTGITALELLQSPWV